ncbi:MAG: hypothetical protein V4579_07130 [Pseudomonadota bacterium]
MNEPTVPSREQRLAQKLRNNLHRRKAQARTMAQTVAGGSGDPPGADCAGPESPDALPKAPAGR